jgi:hypothetical protein
MNSVATNNMAMVSVVATTLVAVEEAMAGVVRDIAHNRKTMVVTSQHVKYVAKLVTLP